VVLENIYVTKILKEFEKLYPDATTSLKYETPFELLVATMLSAQSTDKQVNKITSKLFKQFNTPEEFAALEPCQLEEIIKGCGLFRTKSKNIIETSRILVEKYGGQVPRNLEALVELPGVGRKTANVVLSNAFNEDAIAVDTHVFRVANRLGLANSKTPLGTELQLRNTIPKELWSKAHHWLITHGRQVCLARNPRCYLCTLAQWCKSRKCITENKRKELKDK